MFYGEITLRLDDIAPATGLNKCRWIQLAGRCPALMYFAPDGANNGLVLRAGCCPALSVLILILNLVTGCHCFSVALEKDIFTFLKLIIN